MKNVDYAEIGARIRTARFMQKLTQEEASEKCDITTSYYGNIERGDKKMSVETLIKVAKGLNISTDELLFGDTADEWTEAEEFLKEVQRTVDREYFTKYLTVMKAIASIIHKL